MRRVVVTGLGFITSIGNSKAQVLDSLQRSKTGIEFFDEFNSPSIPIKLAGTIKGGFHFGTTDFEDWVIPSEYQITREQLRSMAPHCVYGFCAMQQAISDAGLKSDEVSHPKTGVMCASGGSMWLIHSNLDVMFSRGIQHCSPMSVISSIPGTLNINLVSCFKIKGSSLGFSSACSSSSHALGHAFDLIRAGKQDRIFVIGAEDLNLASSLPFAAMRALSTQKDPSRFPCAFDVQRDGFVVTGGATALVLEAEEIAQKKNRSIYAEVLGWGQASDGFHVASPSPDGDGLGRAMLLAMEDARIQPEDIDYINAHATSTIAGDIAEIRSIKKVFDQKKIPFVSSTKSLTGHGLSLSGAMESAFCSLAIKERFMPVSANIRTLAEECKGVPVITSPIQEIPRVVMSNSSAFGGSNVSLIFRNYPS
jgi:3-oxoacyl-[acyl-carrier-protein] synthase-1